MKNVLAGCSIVLVTGLLSTAVSAAEPVLQTIINNNGIAFSRLEEGRVIAYDPVAAYEQHMITEANCDAFRADYQGVSWCFANAENLQMFQAAAEENRSTYVPFAGGHCTMGMANGNLVARGDPRTAVRIGNTLVLNGNFNVRTSFLTDTERNMDNARLRFQMAQDSGRLSPLP